MNDTSFIAKIRFHNAPDAGRFYQTFRRFGSTSNPFRAVGLTALDGSILDSIVTETFMRPEKYPDAEDMYLHPGDTIALVFIFQACFSGRNDFRESCHFKADTGWFIFGKKFGKK